MTERVEFIEPLIYVCGHKQVVDEAKDISSIFNRLEECIEAQNRAKRSIVFIDILNNNTFEVLKNFSFDEYSRTTELNIIERSIIHFLKTETLGFIEKMETLLLNQIEHMEKNHADLLESMVISSSNSLQEFKDCISEINSL